MRIDKVEIDGFGKLNNVSYTFSDGVNLIYGENESGKSTLCEFILSAFYGLPNESKKVSEDITPRKKYRPWNTESFGGRVYFTDNDGRELVIERSFKGTKRGDKAALRDAATWEELDNSDDIGEKLFGLSREAFLKTLYVKSFGADNLRSDDGEIMSRLSNLETSGAEDVSYSKIINAMEKEIFSLKTKTGRGGKISALQDREVALKQELSISQMTYSALSAEEENVRALKDTALKKEQEAVLLEEKYRVALAHEKYLDNKKIHETKDVIEKRLKSAKENLEAITKQINSLDIETSSSVSAEEISRARELETKKLIAKDRVASLEKSQQEGNKSNGTIAAVAVALLGVVLAIVGAVIPMVAVLIAGAVLLVCGGVMFALYSKKVKENKVKAQNFTQASRELKEIETELSEIFAPYGVKISDELSALFMSAKDKDQKRAELIKQYNDTKSEIESLTKSIPHEVTEEFSEGVMSYTGESADGIFAKINMLKSESRQMSEHAAELDLRIARETAEIRKEAVIVSELDEVCCEIESLEKRHSALTTAAGWLERAHSEIKNNFAPRLNEKASRMLSYLTKEKYTDLRANDNFHINLKSTGGEIVEAGYMSRGTYDLLYIALRFAAMSVLTEGKIPTVILDDAFSQLDDTRLLAAVELINETADFSQVLLFTCHENYKHILKNCHITELQ